MDEEGNPRAILARIEATFSVEDWGYVTVDGKRIISMTSNEESHGIHGGHPTWPAQTKSAIVSSGTHQLQFHYENIDMADASNNKLVCEYAYRVVALEDGGRKEEEECGCGGSTCSPEGGLPEARSLVPGVASSSAGSEVSASITEDSLFWSCNVGVLRGMGAALGGKVVLQAASLSAELASPAALLFNHPMAARLVLPEGGVQPGCRLEIQRGNRVLALRYYSDGVLAPVGVDTAGLGVASLLPAEGEVPTSLRWQEASGAAWRFSQEDGALLSYTSPEGVLIEDVSACLAVKRVEGALRQVWSFWDGLLNVEDVSPAGYSLALYTPDAVAGQDAATGLFTLVEGAAAFKRFDFVWDDESASLAVTESAPQRQSVVTRWHQDAAGAWCLTRGAGEEAVTTMQSRTVLEPASAATGALEVWQLVTTV